MRRWINLNLVMLVMMCLMSVLPVNAQGNLLSNSGFESNFSGRGRGDFNFAENWGGWFTESPRNDSWMNLPPNAFPHTSYYKYGGAAAQSISKGGGTFTAAAYQEVGGIPAGAIVRGSAFVFIENSSKAESMVRVGVGSNVGDNPFGGDVTWSPWMTTLTQYQQISVDHVAAGGNVTIFIYATQKWPNDPNAVYIDDAALVIVGDSANLPENQTEDNSGDDSGGDDQASSVPASVPPAVQSGGVAFVRPQNNNLREGITHTVNSGDTLASIATGYGVNMNEIMSLNGLDKSSILQIGQVLTIATPDPNAPEPTVAPTATPEATPDNSEFLPVATEEVTSEVNQPTDNQPTVNTDVVLAGDTTTTTDETTGEPAITQEMIENFRANCSITLILRSPFFKFSCEVEN